MKICIFLLLLSITTLTVPGCSTEKKTKTSSEKQPSNKLFCWEAADNDSVVYLQGTIHVGILDMYPLDKKIEKGFQDSESLIVELDMINVNPLDLQKKMMYSPPESLKSHVSSNVYSELCNYLAKNYGISEAQISMMKPSLILSTILMLKMQEYGYSPMWGVDMYLMGMRGDKKIVELETLDFQLDLFDTIADKLLGKELEKLKDEDKLKEVFGKMISSWKEGDPNKMEKVILDELKKDKDTKEVYKLMFIDRNKKMADKILKIMDKPGTNFVAVGAGHMIGKEGIISLLSENKKVKQLLATPKEDKGTVKDKKEKVKKTDL